MEPWLQSLRTFGASAHVVAHLESMALLHREGRYDRSSGDVSLLTGVPPMSVEDFVHAHRNDFMKADARKPRSPVDRMDRMVLEAPAFANVPTLNKEDVMAERNADQIADWNGQSGERWVAHQARLDAMVSVFGQAAIDAAAPAEGERVLDVGCGAGASSMALAARVGAEGQVLGVDISEALIGRAGALAPQDLPVMFEVADASSAELPEGAFDILFSRFGVMFFDDPTAAFTHMRRALRPGGRVAFVCWRGAAENDWVRLPMGALKGIVPTSAPPDPEAPGPFSFGDRGRVARILTAAGFTDIAIAPFDASVPFGEGETRDAAIDDAVKMTLEVGPLSRALADQPDDVHTRASAAVRAVFAGLPGERSVMIDSAAWIVMARNPAG